MIPESIRAVEDPFSKELVRLWDERDLKGQVFTYGGFSEKDFKVYILVEESVDYCTIRGLYTLPEFRGQGLATTLLRTVCSYYSDRPLVVNIGEGAENVYIRNGFRLLGRRKDFPDQTVAYRGDISKELYKKLVAKTVEIHKPNS